MPYIDILIVSVFLSVTTAAGYWTALWKGRPQNRVAWAICGGLFAVLLPVLLLFRSGPEEKRVRRRFVVPLIVVANALVVLQTAGFLFLLAYQGTTGLPLCNSQAAHDITKEAVASGPTSRRTGIQIVDIAQVEELSASPMERRCRGSALMNDGSERPISFKIFYREQGGPWFVLVERGP